MASDDPSPKPPVNPFDAARARPSSDVTVVWTVQDVQLLRPDWDPRKCEEFLNGIFVTFAAGMLRQGMTVLLALSVNPRFGGAPKGPPKPKNAPES